MPRIHSGLVVSSALLTAFVIGCSKPASAPPKAGTQTQAADAPADDEAAEIAKAIAMLPEAERPVAMAQKVCPVGDGPLGSMGMPYKVTVKGRDVYLCCEGCKDAIEKDPEKYLAKLDAYAK